MTGWPTTKWNTRDSNHPGLSRTVFAIGFLSPPVRRSKRLGPMQAIDGEGNGTLPTSTCRTISGVRVACAGVPHGP